jgi:hypothetical protein
MPHLKLREAYEHLARHYREQFGKHPPELLESAPPEKKFAECAPDELVVQPWDYSEFKQYHEVQGVNMWWLTLEAWEAAVSGVERYGFRREKEAQAEAKKSRRLFRKLSARFKSAIGREEKTSLSAPVRNLAEAVADAALSLEKTKPNKQQAEKLLALAGALRTFVERYAHAGKLDIEGARVEIFGGISKALGRVFEHIAPARYSREDMVALLAAADEMTLLAKRYEGD